MTIGPRESNDEAMLATGFSRALRAAGLDAPPSATIDFALALGVLGITRPELVFWAGRACFCRGPDDSELYVATFVAYFGQAGTSPPGGRLTREPPSPVPALAGTSRGAAPPSERQDERTWSRRSERPTARPRSSARRTLESALRRSWPR